MKLNNPLGIDVEMYNGLFLLFYPNITSFAVHMEVTLFPYPNIAYRILYPVSYNNKYSDG